MVNQPFIPNILNKLYEIFHQIILFYRSYYGHSTKVEKNHDTKTLDTKHQSLGLPLPSC
jgi:hypothetical protein